MPIIAIIALLALGVFIAWVVDINFLKSHHKGTQLEGYTLSQMLKESKSYEAIRKSQKVPPVRTRIDDHHRRRELDEPRHRGDGGQVLHLRSRKEMR